MLSGSPSQSQISTRIQRLRPALCICLLVLFGSFLGGASAQAKDIPAQVPRLGLPFAIGDFNKADTYQDDIAYVSEEQDWSSFSHYWIHIQLSAGGEQAIHVVGPLGGLRIAARDVNRDDVVDLVVSAAWREGPVAVLLNDGRGVFSLVDPSSYPEASDGSQKTLNRQLSQQTETVATLPQFPVAELSETKYMLPAGPVAGFVSIANSSSFLSSLLVSLLGRAPPQASRS